MFLLNGLVSRFNILKRTFSAILFTLANMAEYILDGNGGKWWVWELFLFVAVDFYRPDEMSSKLVNNKMCGCCCE